MDKKEVLQIMSDILLAHGFIRKGNSFLRIQGDGVVQSITLHREGRYPFSALLVEGAVHSLDYPDVFGRKSKIMMSLETPFYMKLFEGYHIENGLDVKDVPELCGAAEETYPLERELEILEKECLPVLNWIATQEQLYHFMLWRDKRELGSVNGRNPRYIYPLLRLKCYSEAEEVCDKKLAQTEEAFQLNCKIWKESEIPRMREWYDERNKETIQIKKLLKKSEYEKIEERLNQNREFNLETYVLVMKKAGVQQLERAGIVVI